MIHELIINKWRSQSNWYILCAKNCVTILDLCYILSLFTYIAALKLDLFVVKDTLCTGIWNNKYFIMYVLRQFKLCTCKLA